MIKCYMAALEFTIPVTLVFGSSTDRSGLNFRTIFQPPLPYLPRVMRRQCLSLFA